MPRSKESQPSFINRRLDRPTPASNVPDWQALEEANYQFRLAQIKSFLQEDLAECTDPGQFLFDWKNRQSFVVFATWTYGELRQEDALSIYEELLPEIKVRAGELLGERSIEIRGQAILNQRRHIKQ